MNRNKVKKKKPAWKMRLEEETARRREIITEEKIHKGTIELNE